jgi:hypothetical protein
MPGSRVAQILMALVALIVILSLILTAVEFPI